MNPKIKMESGWILDMILALERFEEEWSFESVVSEDESLFSFPD